MNGDKDILYKLKWFNNPDNMKGTDTVAWIPRRVIAEAINEINYLREKGESVKDEDVKSLDEMFANIPQIPYPYSKKDV